MNQRVTIGDCELWCGDARRILPALTARFAAVVTDPPYGLGNTTARARPSNYQRAAGMTARVWDREPADVLPLLPLAPVIVIWGGNYYPLPPSRGWLSWFKPDAPPSMASVEFAWTNRDMNARQISHTIAATNAERVGHPTQKPLRVMRWCLETAGVPRGGTVLDPYFGSGTTAVACIQTGRPFVGCEIDPTYFAIAVKRIEEANGKGTLFASPAAAPDLFAGEA
jgi:site-specific DNA-methyltransferase (adenine-specific)